MFEFYLRHEYAFAAVQLLLAMLGMGATLTLRDFVEVVRDPKGFATGFGLQVLLVPLAALGFIALLDLSPGVAVGLALCAAIPGGTVSNIFTYLARGHVALSIALTGVTTLVCVFSTPIVLGLLIAQYMPADFEMPAGRIAQEIGLYLLLPLVVGMGVLRYAPRIAPTLSRWAIRGSLFVIALIVVGALGAGRLDLETFGGGNVLVVAGFIAVLTAMGALLPRLAGRPWEDVAAINLEVTVRNTNLGLLIKASLFPAVVGVADPVGDNVLFTVLLYGGLQLAFGGVMIGRFRRRAAAQDRAAGAPEAG